MDYSGYTWLFKSPSKKVTADEVRQALVVLTVRRLAAEICF
jgi:hypothetical protein